MGVSGGLGDAPISAEERGVLRLVTLGAVAITLWSFTSGATARTVFAMRFGATDSQIGLINALPQLILVMQFLFVRWVQRHGKKRILFPSLALAALILTAQAVVPRVAAAAGDRTAIWTLIGIVSLAYVVWIPGQTAWFPLLNDCIPAAVRGRYLARMRTWWLAATVVAMLVFMVWIGRDEEAPIGRYQVLFAQSVLWALLVIVFFRRLPESASERATSFLSRRRVWAGVLRDRPYRRFLFGHTVVSFAWMTLLVFTAAYMKRGLRYPEWLLIFSYPFAWAIGSVATLWVWGRIADHAGNRPVFFITLPMMIATAGGWVLILSASPAAKVGMGALSMLGGAAWSGYFIAATRQCLIMAPKDNQTPYLAAWMIVRGLGFAAGPLLAGLALDALGSGSVLPVRPGVWHLNRYTLCFGCLVVCFVGAALIFRGLRTPGEMGTRRLAVRAMARLMSWR